MSFDVRTPHVLRSQKPNEISFEVRRSRTGLLQSKGLFRSSDTRRRVIGLLKPEDLLQVFWNLGTSYSFSEVKRFIKSLPKVEDLLQVYWSRSSCFRSSESRRPFSGLLPPNDQLQSQNTFYWSSEASYLSSASYYLLKSSAACLPKSTEKLQVF